jgi:hypothetical protein
VPQIRRKTRRKKMSFVLVSQALAFSIHNKQRLSLYRHPFLYTLFSSRFTLIINNKNLCSGVSAAGLRINLHLDGAPITSKSHTHPSHSQTSRLLTSSLSLGVPVPRPTQCM